MTAIHLKSPGLFSVFCPFEIMLSFRWSPLVLLFPSSPVPFFNPLVVPRVPITIDITITFMSHSFFSVLSQGLGTYLSFHFLSVLLCSEPERQITRFGRFSPYNLFISTYLSQSVYIYLSINLSIYTSLFISLSLFLALSLSIYLSHLLTIYLSIQVCPSLSLSLSLSIYLSIYLSLFISLFLSLTHSLTIYLSISVLLSLSLSLFLSLTCLLTPVREMDR